jgi:F-type H+/Na+-transporting ATPase subunit alpha
MKKDNIESDFFSVFEKNLDKFNVHSCEKAGVVLSCSDGMCFIKGLYDSFINELIVFDSGAKGIIFNLSNEYCSAFFLTHRQASSGEGVKGTGRPYSIPVSEDMCGRVIDVEGNSVDGMVQTWGGSKSEFSCIESDIPGVIDRVPVSKPITTGVLLIDSIVPIGKGQRQLFIGNRGTGKTTLISDIIVNQKADDVLCIYVAISQKQADIANIVYYFEKKDVMDNCIVILADAGKPALHHYLAPYVGMTLAEYFSKKHKRDVLVVFDDLSNHAVAYREMSLLMRTSPAREAYPGDIFYAHARLLERSGAFMGSGSITALPIAQLQDDDITGYISTNLISITDGQMFFDTKLFNSGILPAINTELSVSRVGGSAQPESIRKLSGALRLNLAEYHELSVFLQFGGDLDDETLSKLKVGSLLVSLMNQTVGMNYTVADEFLILFLFKNYNLELQEKKDHVLYIKWLIDFVKLAYEDVYIELNKGFVPSKKIMSELKEIIEGSIT